MARDTNNTVLYKNAVVMLRKTLDHKCGLYAGKIGLVVSIEIDNVNEEDKIEILFEGLSQPVYIYPIENTYADSSLITISGKVYPVMHAPKDTMHHYQ